MISLNQQSLPADLSKIITFRFARQSELKAENFKKGQTIDFTGLIEEESKERFDIAGTWTRIDEYPTSFVANFRTTWNGYDYLGEVHINYDRHDFDAVMLKYNNLLRT